MPGGAFFGGFGILAVIVAGIGLYSVLAFAVAQRRRELGIRAALGASSPRLMRLVIGRGILVASVGVAAGLVLAFVAAPMLRPLLFNVSPRDPLIFAAVAVGLGLVAVAASVLPAWRAARVDPVETLRIE